MFEYEPETNRLSLQEGPARAVASNRALEPSECDIDLAVLPGLL